MDERKNISSPEECAVCGHKLNKVHCTFVCGNCGFKTDCSDL